MSREIMWKTLEKVGVRIVYIEVIQYMYEGVSTCVRTQDRQTVRDREKSLKFIRETVKKNLKINELDKSMIIDGTL